MYYSLYEDPSEQEASLEADLIINKFLKEMKEWQERWGDLGAMDTASREAFAINVASKLGIKVG